MCRIDCAKNLHSTKLLRSKKNKMANKWLELHCEIFWGAILCPDSGFAGSVNDLKFIGHTVIHAGGSLTILVQLHKIHT